MNKKLLIMLLATLLVFSLVFTACNNEETPDDPVDTENGDDDEDNGDDDVADEPAGEKVYRYAEASETTSINGHNETASYLQGVLNLSHSGLYRQVPTADGLGVEYIGDIADGDPVQVDDEGYVWRINLHEDRTWNNGDPINADTFIYSYKMLVDPDLVNSMASFFYDNFVTIENAQEYYMQGQEGNDPVDWEDVGIEKVDEYAFEITTTQLYPANHVLRHFADRSMFPVHEETYEAGMNDSRTATVYGTDVDNYMGCGPYILESWNYESDRNYTKNEDHWLSDYYNYDKVVVRIIPEENARVQMFENGELDYISLSTANVDNYRDDPRTVTSLGLATTHIDINSINTENPILQSLNFRKALYWAMDRDIIAGLTEGAPMPYYINHQAEAWPEQGITYRQTEEAKAIEMPNDGYDPELAVEYFEAALEEVGEESVTVSLMYSDTSENCRRVGEFLQQSLPEIFGEDRFELEMRSVPSANFTAMKDWKSDPNSFELAFGGWGPAVSRISPYRAFQYFIDDYQSRPNSYSTDRFNEYFHETNTEEVRLDQQLMLEKSAELEKIYLEDVINVPIYVRRNYEVYSDKIQLPFDEYVSGFGFGVMFADIVE